MSNVKLHKLVPQAECDCAHQHSVPSIKYMYMKKTLISYYQFLLKHINSLHLVLKELHSERKTIQVKVLSPKVM